MSVKKSKKTSTINPSVEFANLTKAAAVEKPVVEKKVKAPMSQEAYNVSVGLPENWRPKIYFETRASDRIQTPRGITIIGDWNREDLPIQYSLGRVRVFPELIDNMWRIDELLTVEIYPTIWWSDLHSRYIGNEIVSFGPDYKVKVALWYKSETSSGKEYCWWGTRGRDGLLFNTLVNMMTPGRENEPPFEIIP